MTSGPPDTVERLRLTSRGRLVLATAAVVVVVLVVVAIAAVAGFFSGSTQKSCGSAGPSCAAPATIVGASGRPAGQASADPSAATRTTTTAKPKPKPTAVHRVTATTAAWRLPTSLSRVVVLPYAGGLELLGGLLDGDHSSPLVQHLTLTTGAVTADGRLATGVHDAAGAAYKGQLFVYAGGASREVAGVQRAVPGGTAVPVGALPVPRSDLVEATVGAKVVLLGGYDGTSALADVLVSPDGVHFSVLTRLPVPVRYPAPVVRGQDIYLYGGDVDRKPADVIQRIDVATGTASVVGHLPEPISHEAALVFGRTVWLDGGTDPGGTSARMYRSDDGLTFTRSGSLPQPRSDAGVAMVHGVGYLVGGEGAARFDTVVVVKPG